MADADIPQDAPFNLEKLLALVELMEKHGLTEVSLKRGAEKWKLRRGPLAGTAGASPFGSPVAYGPGVFGPGAPGAGYPASTLPANAPPSANEAGSFGQPSGDQEGTVTINSPTVGTFYTSPTPDDPPFVSVGLHVQPDTVVCVVEAMKVFNQIPAEVSGTIVSVLVKNGESVEFGQPLFRVRPS